MRETYEIGKMISTCTLEARYLPGHLRVPLISESNESFTHLNYNRCRHIMKLIYQAGYIISWVNYKLGIL